MIHEAQQDTARSSCSREARRPTCQASPLTLTLSQWEREKQAVLTRQPALPSAHCPLPTVPLRLFAFAFAAFAFSLPVWLARRLRLALLFCRPLWLMLWIADSFSLRLRLTFALGFLLRRPLSARCLFLSTRIFSLLLLNLTRLTLSFLTSSCRFGALPVYFPFGIRFLLAIAFLLAAVVCLLRFVTLILNLELLISGVVGNSFHGHRFPKVPAKRRLADITADKNRRVPEFLCDARRQIDFAASPGGVDHCVSQRSQGQRIER